LLVIGALMTIAPSAFIVSVVPVAQLIGDRTLMSPRALPDPNVLTMTFPSLSALCRALAAIVAGSLLAVNVPPLWLVLRPVVVMVISNGSSSQVPGRPAAARAPISIAALLP